MPILNWLGKDKVINHHQQVPFRVLEPQYTYGQDDSGNMIVHGDNLDALKALLPRYEGKVKLIYIDPPYNTGNENWVYNDNVNDPKIKRWLGEVVGKEGEDLSRHDKWLCMMYPRLRLLQRLLADDGVIFVSIGDDELTNLSCIMREIFGKLSATLVWKSRSKPTNAGMAKYRPQKVAEYILMYTQDDKRVFNIQKSEDTYSYSHEDEFGKYRTSTILTSNFGTYQRETMRFEVAGYTPPADKRWKAGLDTIQELCDTNRLMFNSDGEPMEKVYEEDNDGINSPFYTLINSDLSGTAENGKAALNAIIGSGHGFDTVKPIRLIEYIISLSTDSDSIILDSFAGSGTTAHAVLNMNKRDGGNRRFILVEMEDYAESITAERVKRVIEGYAKTEGTGGGFSFYELGERLLLEDGNLNENLDTEKIREYIWYTETRAKYVPQAEAHLLGVNANTAYYFYYEKQAVTVLDHSFLHGIKSRAGSYLIYADLNTLSAEEMDAVNIRFKKIPRDITRL